ncbi:MAG: FAD-dependent oxidoreductase [Candidatus Levybacteria bacterium]|nr:FAD-dependent oxidoreductase [Candidatus Levybacteria bacterium]
MKIAVIGAGFTGLSAAYQLIKKGHQVTLFEKDSSPGGLALGFTLKDWQWSIEKHYHHWFANDNSILNLAKELKYNVIRKRAKTSVYIKDSSYQLDSPLNALTFPQLKVIDRLRMAGALGFLRYNPFWKPLEKYQASSFLPKIMGNKPYEMLWEPLLNKKFGSFKDAISLAWFWARIRKRTAELAYPKGGFLEFAKTLQRKIKSEGGVFYYNSEVKNLESVRGKARIATFDLSKHQNPFRNFVFDRVIVTLPSFLFLKIAGGLPNNYQKQLLNLKGLGAINLILRLKKPFLVDGTYWLSICDKKSPIMAIVEHTNFMDKKYYNNEHIIYIGNYLPADHPYMKMTASELLKIYDPYLRKINPNYSLSVIHYSLFKVPFAQPIIPINYSKIMPPFETPLKNIYLANIQQVYPWDRGTNYAVELGEKVAKLISEQK